MDGLQCAFAGRVGQDAELRYTQQGAPLVSVSVSVQDAKASDVTWIRVGFFGSDEADIEDLVRQLAKGAEVYIEGRLKLKTWQGTDGNQRAGLDCHAWKLEVLGRIGHRSPARRHRSGAMPQVMAIPPRSAA